MTTQYEHASIQRADALIRELQSMNARIDVVRGHTRGLYVLAVFMFAVGVLCTVFAVLSVGL